jgi:hypothetical protein
MKANAEHAVRHANKKNVDLDYSIDSIQKVETILAMLHEQKSEQPGSTEVNRLASIYGSYVGEVIRRNEPGAFWEKDHKVGGNDSYPLISGEAEMFPMAWCYKRIEDGGEDNVWVKYQLLQEIKKRPPTQS